MDARTAWLERVRRERAEARLPRESGMASAGGGSTPIILARLTGAGAGGDGYYDAVECDGDGETLSGGRVWDGGDNLDELHEVNGVADLPTGAAGTGYVATVFLVGGVWAFRYQPIIPPPGDQYTVLQSDGSGNYVCDYVRAHE